MSPPASSSDESPLQQLKNRLLRRKPIAWAVVVVTVVGTLVVLANNVFDLWTKAQPEPRDPSRSRTVEAAYSLGRDMPTALMARGLELSEQFGDLESGIRANLNLLNVEATFPRKGPYERTIQLAREEIRPQLARRKDDLVEWYDVGSFWSEVEVGLQFALAYSGPDAPGSPEQNAKPVAELIESAKSEDDYVVAERAERHVELSRQLKQESDEIWEVVRRLDPSPPDRPGLARILVRIRGFSADVRDEIQQL
jgi:hypothetical protein